MLTKITRFTKNVISYITKIKWVKALLALIAILMSYKLIRYFWYFNKIIIYLLGLIFAGINFNDYHFLNEIKSNKISKISIPH